MELNFEKNGGVVIAIVQDVYSKDVLMVGHATPEAVQKTLKSGLATFWSMSRDELWTKGLTSGDTLQIVAVRADCDRDAVLYLVVPQGQGGACHKDGWYSCFGYQVELDGQQIKVSTPYEDLTDPVGGLAH